MLLNPDLDRATHKMLKGAQEGEHLGVSSQSGAQREMQFLEAKEFGKFSHRYESKIAL